jgi:hypothetical protein
MRHIPILLIILCLIACNTAQNQSGNSRKMAQESDLNNTPIDSIQNFLINAAATDFLKTRPPDPLHFRDVRIGHLTGSNGIRRYILCGQFLPSEQKAEWIPFVTIKTDPYEQWLGNQASVYCNDTSLVRENMSDLSSILQSRWDSLR